VPRDVVPRASALAAEQSPRGFGVLPRPGSLGGGSTRGPRRRIKERSRAGASILKIGVEIGESPGSVRGRDSRAIQKDCPFFCRVERRVPGTRQVKPGTRHRVRPPRENAATGRREIRFERSGETERPGEKWRRDSANSADRARRSCSRSGINATFSSNVARPSDRRRSSGGVFDPRNRPPGHVGTAPLATGPERPTTPAERSKLAGLRGANFQTMVRAVPRGGSHAARRSARTPAATGCCAARLRVVETDFKRRSGEREKNWDETSADPAPNSGFVSLRTTRKKATRLANRFDDEAESRIRGTKSLKDRRIRRNVVAGLPLVSCTGFLGCAIGSKVEEGNGNIVRRERWNGRAPGDGRGSHRPRLARGVIAWSGQTSVNKFFALEPARI